MLLIGHRGLGADRFNPSKPENSIDSLVSAAALPGIAAVEYDVMATLDGKLVLHHDFFVDGVAIGTTNFSELPKQLPVFSDFLKKYQNSGKGMICEIKFPMEDYTKFSSPLSREATADAVLAQIADYPPAWFYVSSFDPDLCVALAKKTTTIFNVWFGHDFPDKRTSDPREALKFCAEICKGGICAEISWLLKNEWFVAEAKKLEVRIFTYGTENTERAVIEKQRSWGVYCVIADCVDRLIN